MVNQLFVFLIVLFMWKFWSNLFKKHNVQLSELSVSHQLNVKNEEVVGKMIYTDVMIILNKLMEMDKSLLDRLYLEGNTESNKKKLNEILEERIKSVDELSRKYQFIFADSLGGYDSFSASILTHHPYLTEKELRLCYYIKLNLDSKEIAAIEGLTQGSVRVYKTKLKSKLNLKPIENLTNYLNKLELAK